MIKKFELRHRQGCLWHQIRRCVKLLLAIFPLLLISCGAKPIELTVASGGSGQIQIEVELKEGYKFAQGQGISAIAPELEGIKWELKDATFVSSPVDLKFAVDETAKSGRRAGNLEITIMFCESSNTLCLIRQKNIPINISVVPQGSQKAMSAYSISVKP